MGDNNNNNNININTRHVISWPGGKDSTATILLFKEHWNELVKPGDKVTILFAEIMYDNFMSVI